GVDVSARLHGRSPGDGLPRRAAARTRLPVVPRAAGTNRVARWEGAPGIGMARRAGRRGGALLPGRMAGPAASADGLGEFLSRRTCARGQPGAGNDLGKQTVPAGVGRTIDRTVRVARA